MGKWEAAPGVHSPPAEGRHGAACALIHFLIAGARTYRALGDA